MDLEKTYDHVNWNFLVYMLRRCGFGGEIVPLDNSLYFLGVFLGFGEQYSHSFF
jgi:hypothetical protein